MEIRVTQVAIRDGESVGIVLGVPIDDLTKVIVAGADWRAAYALGEAIARGEDVVVEVPDWAILRILEAP